MRYVPFLDWPARERPRLFQAAHADLIVFNSHFILWFLCPLIFACVWIVFERVAALAIIHWAVNENGPIEILQFVIAFAGFLAAVCTASFLLLRRSGQYGFVGLFVLAALGCLYIAGEEVSWGQWFFGWTTPPEFQILNDQNETNFHNISSWFDQKPRLVIEIGMIALGLALPLMAFLRIFPLSRLRQVWVPSFWCIGYMFLFLQVKAIDMAGFYVAAPLFVRGSEILELFIYYFIAVYIATTGYRLLRQIRS